MALIDKASLLMVPSTYEAGKLYNVLPSGNRAPDSTNQNSGYDQTRADFDFDRGSNASATRIGSDGLIKKYRENLLLQSNNFGTTWATTSASITSGQSGYDGTNNAWLLNESAVGGRIRQTISGSGVMTMSLYAKSGSLDYLLIYVNTTSSDPYAYFDLATGVLGNTSQTIDAKIEDAGNGWYRCSVTGNVGTLSAIEIYPANSTSSHTTTAGSVYIQSAQLESGLVATDYLDSTSVTGKAGVLVDLPRINFDANGENGALLLEPSRQNLVAYSEYITGFSTSNTGVSIEENATTSPEGVVNAAKIKEDATNAAHAVRQLTGPTLTSGTDYTFSFFAKKGERSIVALSNTIGASNAANCFFDLENGQVLTNQFNSASIEDFGNGWYRCIATDTADAADDYDTRIYTATADNQFSHQGVSGSGLYIYGIQLEAGSYVSSYIPCMGTSETRAADSCSVTGVSDVIGQTEGTMFMDVNLYARDSYTYFALAPNLGSTSSYIGILITATAFSFEVVYSGVQVAYNYSNSNTGNFKIAFAYKANDFVAYVNGTQVMTDTSGNVPACSQIALNQYDKDQPLLYKQAILFNERLTNSELATLTTL